MDAAFGWGIAFVILVFAVGAIIFAIRLWSLVGEADEYFARENERYRREYERQRHS